MIAFTLVLSTSLAAAPVTLASPEFNTLNISADVARFCSEHLAQQLVARGIQVTTARQMGVLLGLERQKQLLGCSAEGASCMAELAAALGTDGLLLGDLGRLGKKVQIDIKVLRPRDSETVATWARSVSGEDELLDALTQAAEELAPKIQLAFRAKPAAPAAYAQVSTSAHRSWPLVPTALAAGLAAAGGVCFGLSASAHGDLTSATAPAGSMNAEAANALAARGEALQWASRGAFAGAGAALVVAAVLYFTSGEAPVAVAIAPAAGSVQAAVGGRF